jgi:hypothetical protein
MANEKKSLVEEALLQMKNLEEAVTENAKGILASTMKQEISELVKESLSLKEDEVDVEMSDIKSMSEQDMDDMEDETEDELEMDNMDIDMDSDEESDMEDEMGMDLPDEFEVDDDEEVLLPLDLTGASDEEILKVFKAMGEDDGIIVTKDNENIHLKDENDGVEYQIQMEGDEDMEDMDNMDMEDTIEEMDDMDEIVYEIEMEDDDEEEEEEVEEGEHMNEASMTVKPKGEGFGKAGSGMSKSSVNNKGFNGKMKTGNKTMGMNLKPKKFEFTEEEEDMVEGDYGMNKDDMSKSRRDYETTEGQHGGNKGDMSKSRRDYETKEEETTEASRTLGNGSMNDPRRKGLPKKKVRTAPLTNESELKSEINSLRSKNDEYRKALNIFRDKLNEVAVFNSNLAYTVRLFTEHSTTKQEKINILKRFDSVETIKESKTLYKTIREDLGTKTNSTITESVESKIQKSPTKGSATNLIESKTYENPQFMRMKDLMSKINK